MFPGHGFDQKPKRNSRQRQNVFTSLPLDPPRWRLPLLVFFFIFVVFFLPALSAAPGTSSEISGFQSAGGCLRSVIEMRSPPHALMQCLAISPLLPPSTNSDLRGSGSVSPSVGVHVQFLTVRKREPDRWTRNHEGARHSVRALRCQILRLGVTALR